MAAGGAGVGVAVETTVALGSEVGAGAEVGTAVGAAVGTFVGAGAEVQAANAIRLTSSRVN